MNKITSISSSLPSAFNVFSKQLDVDGVQIYAAAEVSDAQLNYVASVLRQLLSADDGTILSNMVKNGAGLTMFANATQRDANEAVYSALPNRLLQDLQADEVVPPGTSTVRDATVEEVTHLIHNSGLTAARPETQKALDVATQSAIKAGLFFPEKFTDDLPAADYDDEYLASGVEAYFNITHPDLAQEQIITSSTHDQLKLADPALYNIIKSVFPATLPAAQGTSFVEGSPENDVLTGTSNNETFYGLAGTDTLKFDMASSDYVTSKNSSGINVTGPNGNDNLISIERLQFSDQQIAFETDGNAAQIYRLYKAALDRAPDKVGLGYWINDADKGSGLANIASGFIESNEFIGLYGANISDSQYLTALYQNVLNRAPDTAGLQFWSDTLSSGQDNRAGVLLGFSESAEHKINVAGEIESGIIFESWLG